MKNKIHVKKHFKKITHSSYSSIIIGLFLVVLSIVIWKLSENNSIFMLSQQMDSIAEIHAREVERRINHIEFNLTELVGYGVPKSKTEEENWDTRTLFYIQNQTGIKSIVLLDRDTKVLRVMPSKDSGYTIDNQMGDEEFSNYSVLIYPIYEGNNIVGFIIVNIDISELILSVNADLGSSYMIEIYKDDQLMVTSDNFGPTRNDIFTQKEITFKTDIFTFTLKPTQTTLTQDLSDSYLILGFGILLSIFASLIWHLVTSSNRKLEILVSKKTEELNYTILDLLTSQKIAGLGTWRLDVKTNNFTMSEELYKMYGFDSNQPVPPYTEHMKLFTKQSGEQLSTALALTRTQGIPYALELEMAIKDESRRWMWVRGEAEYDDQGHIVSLTGADLDITKIKQLEQNLKEAHQIAKLGRWELIHNEDRLVWSETIFDIFEIKSDRFDSSYEGFLNLIHKDDRSRVDEAYKESLVNKQAYSIEHRLLMEDGRIKWISEKINTEFDENDQPVRSVGVVQDITDKKIKEEENIYIANHDYLTNLYNRRYFVNAFDAFTSNDGSSLGLMMIDINGLKLINDAYGHVRGDEAIRSVANLLLKVFDQDDVVARIGGDEFAILAPHKNAIQLQAYKDKLVLLSHDIKIDNIPVSLAIGFEILTKADKDIDALLTRAENHLYRHKITVGESIRNHAIKAILNTLTDKYKEEKIHSAHVSQLCKQIGTELKLNQEDIDILELAGMYHDIGKISIPDAILNKPDKLTDEEYDIMKTHTQIGYQILRAADEYSGLAEYALSHHERWDGKGYPKGLRGKDIPLFSRIINIADSFEAMTADRPYRKGISIEDAIAEIKRCSGSQFDPEIANLFLSKVLKYKH